MKKLKKVKCRVNSFFKFPLTLQVTSAKVIIFTLFVTSCLLLNVTVSSNTVNRRTSSTLDISRTDNSSEVKSEIGENSSVQSNIKTQLLNTLTPYKSIESGDEKMKRSDVASLQRSQLSRETPVYTDAIKGEDGVKESSSVYSAARWSVKKGGDSSIGRRRGAEERGKKYKYPVSEQRLDVRKFPVPSIKRVTVGEVSDANERSERLKEQESQVNSSGERRRRERRDDEGQSSYTGDREVNYYSARSTVPLNHMQMPKSLSLSTSGGTGCPNWHSSSSESWTDDTLATGHSDNRLQQYISASDTSTRYSPSSQQKQQEQNSRTQSDEQVPLNSVNCSCYDFDDGLFIECPNTDIETIKKSFESIRMHNMNQKSSRGSDTSTHATGKGDSKSNSNTPSVTIKSYTIYNMDWRVHQLPSKLFSSIKQIEKIRISDTHISQMADDT